MEPLVYASAYEALQRALGPLLDARAIERFRGIGVHFDRKLEPAYPLATSVQALAISADLIAPGQSQAVALERLGRKITSTFGQTVVGKALFATLRVLGTKRGLAGLRRSLRMNNNYTETKLKELAPNEVELWISQVTYPTYYVGILSEGLGMTGAKAVEVELLGHDAQGATYRIRWA